MGYDDSNMGDPINWTEGEKNKAINSKAHEVVKYLTTRELPDEWPKARKVKNKAAKFTLRKECSTREVSPLL